MRLVEAIGSFRTGLFSCSGPLLMAVVFGTAVSGEAAEPTKQLRKLTSLPPTPKQISKAALAAAPISANMAPLSETFRLQSRPTASKVIYLDFTGHNTVGTDWNSNGNTIVTSPYSFEGDATFSDNEKTQIQQIWMYVAEYFSPFDVNVATLEPPAADLINSGGADTRWGIRVCIGATNPSPAPGAAGIAWLDSFRWNSDTPCFVFLTGAGATYGKYIAVATVHEVGHSLGLDHDGRTSPAEGYYDGHGSGQTGWAPHMGTGYDKNLVHWSKGEYLSANQRQDDLAIITTDNGFGYRQDDFGNSLTSAAVIGSTTTGTTANVDQAGVIETRTDTDWFRINAGAGPLTINAVGGELNTMLDIKLELYNSAGTLLQSNDSPTLVTAALSTTITAAGTYYVKIDGVGNGDPLGTGYTDYSSLGTYRLTGSYTLQGTASSNVTVAFSAPNNTLTLTGDAGNNSVNISVTSGVITVRGANGTTINSTAGTFSVATNGRVFLTGNLNAGNDSVSLVGFYGSTLNLNLGSGVDSVFVNLSDVGTLVVDGGTELDTVSTTTSIVRRRLYTSVP